MALINKLNNIGDAIRAKTGKEDKLTLEQMVTEIAAIETGGSEPAVIEALVVTENGTYTPGEGVDGFSPVTVEVPTGGGSLPEEAFVLTDNCNSRFAYNGWNWFENSDFNNRGIHKFDNLDDLLSYQKDNYINFLKTLDICESKIKNIIRKEFSKPKDNISACEYLEWVVEKGIDI